MKFIDEATIAVQSGKGGRGCVSFRRERFIPRGGPDGGDGGKGGDVLLKATSRKRTLYHFQFKRQFKAEDGAPGQGSQKTGRGGADLVIEVPVGTLVRNSENGVVLADLVSDGDTYVVAEGGRGGRGNKKFATANHRTPRFAQPGEPDQSLSLSLELKLLADVGIIGLPNAGKSTLIGMLSSTHPKIGNYPFTTLSPNLGVMRVGNREPIVLADVPGLIEGAHQGAGLGIRFLRHIERTRMLIHLLDASQIDPTQPLATLEAVNRELALYSERLALEPQLVVLNKIDIPETDRLVAAFVQSAGAPESLAISAVTGEGIQPLIDAVVRMLASLEDATDDLTDSVSEGPLEL